MYLPLHHVSPERAPFARFSRQCAARGEAFICVHLQSPISCRSQSSLRHTGSTNLVFSLPVFACRVSTLVRSSAQVGELRAWLSISQRSSAAPVTQQNFSKPRSVIQKELNATKTVFACRHFHMMLCGVSQTLISVDSGPCPPVWHVRPTFRAVPRVECPNWWLCRWGMVCACVQGGVDGITMWRAKA